MKPATLLLVTFFIWIAAKGRLGKYWELATSSAASLPSDGGAPGSDLTDTKALPGFGSLNPLKGLPEQ